MIHKEGPSGVSYEALQAAIEQAVAHGLDRGTYEAWAECTLLSAAGHLCCGVRPSEPMLVAATNLTTGGLELLLRRPIERGMLAHVRLVRPDGSTEPAQSVVACNTMPLHDRRWYRCQMRYIHIEDLPGCLQARHRGWDGAAA
jgi:hypothetical protein